MRHVDASPQPRVAGPRAEHYQAPPEVSHGLGHLEGALAGKRTGREGDHRGRVWYPDVSLPWRRQEPVDRLNGCLGESGSQVACYLRVRRHQALRPAQRTGFRLAIGLASAEVSQRSRIRPVPSGCIEAPLEFSGGERMHKHLVCAASESAALCQWHQQTLVDHEVRVSRSKVPGVPVGEPSIALQDGCLPEAAFAGMSSQQQRAAQGGDESDRVRARGRWWCPPSRDPARRPQPGALFGATHESCKKSLRLGKRLLYFTYVQFNKRALRVVVR